MKFFEFTREGLPLRSDYSNDVDVKMIAAMSATILSVSERYVKEFAIGSLKRILIDAEGEKLVLSKKGKNGILSIIERDYDRGLVVVSDI